MVLVKGFDSDFFFSTCACRQNNWTFAPSTGVDGWKLSAQIKICAESKQAIPLSSFCPFWPETSIVVLHQQAADEQIADFLVDQFQQAKDEAVAEAHQSEGKWLFESVGLLAAICSFSAGNALSQCFCGQHQLC